MPLSLSCPHAIATYTVDGHAVCGGTLPAPIFPIAASIPVSDVPNVFQCVNKCVQTPRCTGAAYYLDHCYLWTNALDGDLVASEAKTDVSLIILHAKLLTGSVAAGGRCQSGGDDKIQDIDWPSGSNMDQSSTAVTPGSAGAVDEASGMDDYNDTDEHTDDQERESSATIPGLQLRNVAITLAAVWAGVVVVLL